MNFIYCLYCGSENPKDSVFCKNCGKKPSDSSSSKTSQIDSKSSIQTTNSQQGFLDRISVSIAGLSVGIAGGIAGLSVGIAGGIIGILGGFVGLIGGILGYIGGTIANALGKLF